MKSTRKMFIAILLATVFLAGMINTTPAYAATYTAVQNGNWNDPATWGGSIPPTTGWHSVVIPAGITVTVPSNYTAIPPEAGFTNNGTLINNGVFTATGNWFTNNGTFTTSDEFISIGRFENFGLFQVTAGDVTIMSMVTSTNAGTIINAGIFRQMAGSTDEFDNLSGGTFTNNGTLQISDTFYNRGTLTNNATLLVADNGSSLGNFSGATLTNNASGTMTIATPNSGNEGTWNNHGTLEVYNQFTGNAGTFNNTGSFRIGSSAIFDNKQPFTNSGDINNEGTFYNYQNITFTHTSGTITSTGTWINWGLLEHYGTFINTNLAANTGVWNTYCGAIYTGPAPQGNTPIVNLCPTDTPTNTSTPSNTPIFTQTFTPTNTSTPSNTPIFTQTFTPTNTSTPSNTPMPSDTPTCTISVTVPSLISPAHRAHTTDTTPTFNWSQISDALSYRLMIYTEDRSFEYKKRLVGQTKTTYTLTSAEALTPAKYLWRVRTQDTVCSTWTGWSTRNTLFVD